MNYREKAREIHEVRVALMKIRIALSLKREVSRLMRKVREVSALLLVAIALAGCQKDRIERSVRVEASCRSCYVAFTSGNDWQRIQLRGDSLSPASIDITTTTILEPSIVARSGPDADTLRLRGWVDGSAVTNLTVTEPGVATFYP